MQNTSSASRQKSLTRQLIDSVQPTHFATVNFILSRKIENIHGGWSWVKGDDIRYQAAADAIVRTLSKSLVSKSVWKRSHPMVAATISIEGGDRNGKSSGKRPHAHLNLQAPAWVDPVAFEIALWKAARRNPWVLKGVGSIDIQPIRSARASVGYSLKEGLSRVIITGTGSLDAASY